MTAPEIGYSAAIIVKQDINLNGTEIAIDSYNSSDPNKSTGGQWDPAKAGDAGDVICLGGITNSVSIGDAIIYGRLYVGSGTAVGLGANGSIGTHAWLAANNNGIEPGYLVPNANFPFTNISLPDYSEFPTPSAGTVVTTNSGVPVTNSYDSILSGGNYTANTLGNTIVTSPSILVLPKEYSIQNLTILPGASLTVYVGGADSISLSGNSILNQGGLPNGLVIYCTSDVTTFSFFGNAEFTGVLVAPNATGVISGGGIDGIDISGAIMARSLTFIGTVYLHFDEALIQQGIIPPSPSLAASLMAPSMSASGQFQFNVTGVPGFNYVIESSTNLTDWRPVFTNAAPFTFTDTNANPTTQNFYRAVYNQ